MFYTPGGPKKQPLKLPKRFNYHLIFSFYSYQQIKPSNKINFKSGPFGAHNILVAPKNFGGPQKFWWPLKKSLKIYEASASLASQVATALNLASRSNVMYQLSQKIVFRIAMSQFLLLVRKMLYLLFCYKSSQDLIVIIMLIIQIYLEIKKT